MSDCPPLTPVPAAPVPKDGQAVTVTMGDVTVPQVFLEKACRWDDVNGDCLDVRPYVEAWTVTVGSDGTHTTTPLGLFEDESLAAPYAPVSPIDPCDCGELAGDTYATTETVCILVNDAPTTALLVQVRDRATHIRVDTIYEDPATGVRFDPAVVTLTDFKECCP